MTMTLPATAAAPPPRASRDQGLRVVVVLVGLIEGLRALIDVPALFGEFANDPDVTVNSLTILASGVAQLILSFVAVGCAFTPRVRYGIAALAVVVFAGWTSEMPSVFRHGLDVSLDDSLFVVVLMVLKIFVAPLAAVAAIAASWRNRYLAAATVAVTLPTLIDAAAVAGFAIAVSIYGF